MTFSYNFENVFKTLAGLEFEISFLFGFLLSRGIIEVSMNLTMTEILSRAKLVTIR